VPLTVLHQTELVSDKMGLNREGTGDSFRGVQAWYCSVCVGTFMNRVMELLLTCCTPQSCHNKLPLLPISQKKNMPELSSLLTKNSEFYKNRTVVDKYLSEGLGIHENSCWKNMNP